MPLPKRQNKAIHQVPTPRGQKIIVLMVLTPKLLICVKYAQSSQKGIKYTIFIVPTPKWVKYSVLAQN